MKNLILIALLVVLSSHGCKKDSHKSKLADLIKMEIIDSDTTFYFYDDRGRLSKTEEKNHTLINQYEYSDTSHLIKITNNKNEELIYHTNQLGFIDYKLNGTTAADTFYYEPSGFLKKTKDEKLLIVYFRYGNVKSRIYSDYQEEYTYYEDKLNTTNDRQKGFDRWGMISRNLLKSETFDKGTKIATYNYEFDSKSRISKKYVKYDTSPVSTLQCTYVYYE